ncbi:MAG: hypothetical protein Ct9H300mP28_18090 [Pseudomonadota bacterium]|nr:MAG: hypothetical protein Ct9H300mP28_18090 [Pseudomonadota bacterium]
MQRKKGGKCTTGTYNFFPSSTAQSADQMMMLLFPAIQQKTDWEVELGVVIGKPAKYVDQEKSPRSCCWILCDK